MTRTALRSAMLCTGAAGLILEISWLRLFGHVLGATYAVTGLVLGLYLAGLGLGAMWFGRDRPRPVALRLLGRLEAAAALAAAPVPFVLAWLHEVLPWELATQLPVQATLIAALILPASFLAGGSLPAAVAARGSPREATRLYAANTAGAVFGAVAAALSPGLIGVYGTYLGALGLQVGVATAAFFWARQTRAGADEAPATDFVTQPVQEGRPSPRFALWTAAAASGFVLLGMEVLWMRLLSTKLHNSSLTYGLVLAVVIGALFAGARLAPLANRLGSRSLLYVWLAGYVALIASAWLFAAVSGGSTGLPRGDLLTYAVRATGAVVAVVALPCLLLGASLPMLWSDLRAHALSQHVGRLLGINTFASVLGSTVAGALLLPELGISGTLRALIGVASIGVVAAAAIAGKRRRDAGWLGVIGLTLALLMPLPDPQHLGSPLPRGALRVDSRRGANGELSVHRDAKGALALRHNAIYGLGSDSNPDFHRRMGQLALLRHGSPQRVAFLGMGTGITASAALDHPSIRDILVLELMEEVIALNHHFAEANGQLRSDPRVRIVVGDGRRALTASGPALDLVISDLFIPWHPGSSDLYSLELFQVVRQRLAAGGLFALWIPAYQIGEAELVHVMAAFAHVFPTAEGVRLETGTQRPVIGLFGHVADTLPALYTAERLTALAERSRFAPDLWLQEPRNGKLWLGPLPALAARPNSQCRPIVELRAPLSHVRKHELMGARFDAFRRRHFPSP